MAHTWTVVFLLLGLAEAWMIWRSLAADGSVAVRLRLDRSAPGAHLMWDIANPGPEPITVTRLVLETGRPLRPNRAETIALRVSQTLAAGESALIATDVDWTLLSARALAVGDATGRTHAVSRRQLTAIQSRLRRLIERRERVPSARDWLSGATNLAFGVVILGLGFFMLMWVIATG
jgi:hypothetical protein